MRDGEFFGSKSQKQPNLGDSAPLSPSITNGGKKATAKLRCNGPDQNANEKAIWPFAFFGGVINPLAAARRLIQVPQFSIVRNLVRSSIWRTCKAAVALKPWSLPDSDQLCGQATLFGLEFNSFGIQLILYSSMYLWNSGSELSNTDNE